MSHSIITSNVDGDREDGLTPELHKALTDRLVRVLEDDGGQAFYAELFQIAAARNDGKSLGSAVQAYLDKLPEPQRTMFNMRREGRSPTAIAKSMGLDLKPVCRTLARIYADLIGHE